MVASIGSNCIHFGNALSEHSFKSALSGTGQLHFVGTGWDFMGLAAARLARKKGMGFTIWPAVHPGAWGDDQIDVRLYRQADAVFCQSEYERNHLATRRRKFYSVKVAIRFGMVQRSSC